MPEFRWKGFRMGAARVDRHRQIHLWPEMSDWGIYTSSLCTKFRWLPDAIDKEVATGWPDCDGCVREAQRRLVSA